MQAVNLKTDHMEKPLGICGGPHTLSWICSDGIKQTAYELNASVNGRAVYASGKVSDSSMQVRTDFPQKSRDRVVWSVRLWDENDVPGEWSESFFEVGLLNADDWSAKWIDPEMPHGKDERQPAGVLRRRFSVGSTENARLYITAHGIYEARINGKRVGDFILAPGTDDYSKRLQVQTYDIGELLTEGENEITVTVGDGWYRGNIGVDGLCNYYGNDIALLCQIETDGKCIVCSDTGWEASSDGPIRLNDLQKGEEYDARKETIDSWHGVEEKDYGYSVLATQDSVAVTEHERFPGRLFTAPNGETVVDFSQNLAGYTEIRINAHEGQMITLWHGETLDENGNFTQSNFDPGDRNKNGGIPQKSVYICKEGLNVWKPRFAIYGFRYAKVETDADLKDAEFTAIAVYSDMAQTGSFSCGNEDINRLFLNSLWSMRSNFCDIPIDCPTRERAGWTGDAAAFAPTGTYLADCYSVFRKWLGEVRLAQHEDGLVENIAPVNNSGSMISKMLQGSSGWGDACTIVPWTLYKVYGDKAILEENYEMMTKWLEFLRKRARKTRIWNQKNPHKRYLVDQGFHFGEWCEPDVNNMVTMKRTMTHGAPEVATAYYYRSLCITAKAAEILGKKADSKKYLEAAEKARLAYRFTCTDNGKIQSERQAQYVRPIEFGLLDQDEVTASAADLDKLIVSGGYHLNTGFLSTPFLLKVLAENGYTDTAYRLLLQDDQPSWLYAVKKGATSIWETWDGIRPDGTVHDSLNHYSYGSVTGFLFGTVCGIQLEGDELAIAPHPSESIGKACAKWDSPRGAIESSWQYEDGVIRYEFRIPPNTQARIKLPNEEEKTLCSGFYKFECEVTK